MNFVNKTKALQQHQVKHPIYDILKVQYNLSNYFENSSASKTALVEWPIFFQLYLTISHFDIFLYETLFAFCKLQLTLILMKWHGTKVFLSRFV